MIKSGLRPTAQLRIATVLLRKTARREAPFAAIDNAISEAEEEYEATGILLDAKETLASLRRKHFG